MADVLLQTSPSCTLSRTEISYKSYYTLICFHNHHITSHAQSLSLFVHCKILCNWFHIINEAFLCIVLLSLMGLYSFLATYRALLLPQSIGAIQWRWYCCINWTRKLEKLFNYQYLLLESSKIASYIYIYIDALEF